MYGKLPISFGTPVKKGRTVKTINRMKLLSPSAPMSIRKYQVQSPTGYILEEFWQQGDAEVFMEKTLDYVTVRNFRVKLAKDVFNSEKGQELTISGYVSIAAKTEAQAVKLVENMLLKDTIQIGRKDLDRTDTRIKWERKLNAGCESDVAGRFGVEYNAYPAGFREKVTNTEARTYHIPVGSRS